MYARDRRTGSERVLGIMSPRSRLRSLKAKFKRIMSDREGRNMNEFSDSASSSSSDKKILSSPSRFRMRRSLSTNTSPNRKEKKVLSPVITDASSTSPNRKEKKVLSPVITDASSSSSSADSRTGSQRARSKSKENYSSGSLSSESQRRMPAKTLKKLRLLGLEGRLKLPLNETSHISPSSKIFATDTQQSSENDRDPGGSRRHVWSTTLSPSTSTEPPSPALQQHSFSLNDSSAPSSPGRPENIRFSGQLRTSRNTYEPTSPLMRSSQGNATALSKDSARKGQRIPSAWLDEETGVWKCRNCDWIYPNPNPSSRHRREHKKHCGDMQNVQQWLKVVDSAEKDILHPIADDSDAGPVPEIVELSEELRKAPLTPSLVDEESAHKALFDHSRVQLPEEMAVQDPIDEVEGNGDVEGGEGKVLNLEDVQEPVEEMEADGEADYSESKQVNLDDAVQDPADESEGSGEVVDDKREPVDSENAVEDPVEGDGDDDDDNHSEPTDSEYVVRDPVQEVENGVVDDGNGNPVDVNVDETEQVDYTDSKSEDPEIFVDPPADQTEEYREAGVDDSEQVDLGNAVQDSADDVEEAEEVDGSVGKSLDLGDEFQGVVHEVEGNSQDDDESKAVAPESVVHDVTDEVAGNGFRTSSFNDIVERNFAVTRRSSSSSSSSSSSDDESGNHRTTPPNVFQDIKPQVSEPQDFQQLIPNGKAVTTNATSHDGNEVAGNAVHSRSNLPAPYPSRQEQEVEDAVATETASRYTQAGTSFPETVSRYTQAGPSSSHHTASTSKSHPASAASSSTTDSVYEYDVERVVQEQKTHDIMCPVCGSCITNRVILRKRKRYHPPDDSKRPRSLPAPPVPEPAEPEEQTGWGCLSCLALFFRKAPTDEERDSRGGSSCLQIVFPPFPWGRSVIDRAEERVESETAQNSTHADQIERGGEDGCTSYLNLFKRPSAPDSPGPEQVQERPQEGQGGKFPPEPELGRANEGEEPVLPTSREPHVQDSESAPTTLTGEVRELPENDRCDCFQIFRPVFSWHLLQLKSGEATSPDPPVRDPPIIREPARDDRRRLPLYWFSRGPSEQLGADHTPTASTSQTLLDNVQREPWKDFKPWEQRTTLGLYVRRFYDDPPPPIRHLPTRREDHLIISVQDEERSSSNCLDHVIPSFPWGPPVEDSGERSRGSFLNFALPTLPRGSAVPDEERSSANCLDRVMPSFPRGPPVEDSGERAGGSALLTVPRGSPVQDEERSSANCLDLVMPSFPWGQAVEDSGERPSGSALPRGSDEERSSANCLHLLMPSFPWGPPVEEPQEPPAREDSPRPAEPPAKEEGPAEPSEEEEEAPRQIKVASRFVGHFVSEEVTVTKDHIEVKKTTTHIESLLDQDNRILSIEEMKDKPAKSGQSGSRSESVDPSKASSAIALSVAQGVQSLYNPSPPAGETSHPEPAEQEYVYEGGSCSCLPLDLPTLSWSWQGHPGEKVNPGRSLRVPETVPTVPLPPGTRLRPDPYKRITEEDRLREPLLPSVPQEFQPSEDIGSSSTGTGETRLDIRDTTRLPTSGDPHETVEILKSIVYGGLDTTLISLGVLSSATGGDAKTLTVVTIGVANVFFGFLAFLGTISAMYKTDLEKFKQLVGPSYRLNGFLALFAYLLFGLLPPLTYGFSFRHTTNRDWKMGTTCFVVLVCLVLLGWAKAHVTRKRPFIVISTLVTTGFVAAVATYKVGDYVSWLLQDLGLDST